MNILFYMRADQPSRTAEYMALFRAVETGEPLARRLFDDSYALSLLAGNLKLLARVAQWPVVGRLVPAFLDCGWPYTRSSAVVRTRVIDDLVRDAIRDDAKQFVLLGAGFDSRAYRLEEAKNVPAFEVDHPATQSAKHERLRSGQRDLPGNVKFVAVDFEKDDLERELAKAGFLSNVPAVVVWEGVVSYLTESAVCASLTILARLLAPRSQLIFTYVDIRALDDSADVHGSRRWRSWVKRSGEPFVFGLDPGTLAQTLAPYGFRLQRDLSTADAAKLYAAAIERKETGAGHYRIATAVRSGEQ